MEKNLIDLPKGGKVIQSALGNIQYGMPPETIKDSMSIEGGVAEYYIIPVTRFDWKDGINCMEFEFPVYYNFFIRKKLKTKMICDEKTMRDIKVIFRETLLGPEDFSRFHRDFWEGYKAIPDMPKELAHFAVNPFNTGEPLEVDMFIEFVLFDESGVASLKKNVSVNREEYMRLGDMGLLMDQHKRMRKYEGYFFVLWIFLYCVVHFLDGFGDINFYIGFLKLFYKFTFYFMFFEKDEKM